MARLVIGDSSVCMINCHLAAGQNAVRRRNADIAAILEEKAVFPPTDHPLAYVGGGDGTMILDHEIVFVRFIMSDLDYTSAYGRAGQVNGDLNYRIDHRREAILSSIRTGEFANLLAHDQLLCEIKFNRACRCHGFSELGGAHHFCAKVHVRRLPVCVLWWTRDTYRVHQLHYRRYEASVSDHDGGALWSWTFAFLLVRVNNIMD